MKCPNQPQSPLICYVTVMNHYYSFKQGFEQDDANLKPCAQGTMGRQFMMSSVAEFIPLLSNNYNTSGVYISAPRVK